MDKSKHLDPRFSTSYGALALYVMKHKEELLHGEGSTLGGQTNKDRPDGSMLSANFSSDIHSDFSAF